MQEFEIDTLRFSSPTMRASNLEVFAIIDPEVDVGWASRVTVSLFHRQRLIGERTLRNTYIIPDEKDRAEITIESFKIRNMIPFKTFFQNLMPRSDLIQETAADVAVTAALDHHENGHELSIAIDLSDMSRISIGCLELDRGVDRIRLSFFLASSSPIDIDFGSCQFMLKKGKEILAFLDGRFAIRPGGLPIFMEGIVDGDVDGAWFDGMGSLTGFKTHEHNNSFLAHAIRLFEIQVKLS
ncbi:hypothetical protein V8C44DRAFT_362913 [Trichoderma aethiopicum]